MYEEESLDGTFVQDKSIQPAGQHIAADIEDDLHHRHHHHHRLRLGDRGTQQRLYETRHTITHTHTQCGPIIMNAIDRE